VSYKKKKNKVEIKKSGVPPTGNHEKKNEIYQVDIHLHRRLPAIVCDEGLENMFRFVRTYALGKKK